MVIKISVILTDLQMASFRW